MGGWETVHAGRTIDSGWLRTVVREHCREPMQSFVLQPLWSLTRRVIVFG
ncbi:hypothetical protein XaFJ1_GM002806 [Xanthomonas albilineans]|nr:hypothetical protein XaFJ1_GM002806 [Xanthomonas albilineans]